MRTQNVIDHCRYLHHINDEGSLIYKVGNETPWFPDPRISNPIDMPDEDYEFNYYRLTQNTVIGGELNPEWIELAYHWGYFPWFAYKIGQDVEWTCPLIRYVIFPEEIHISHSMRNLLNKKRYQIYINKDFDEVIRNCATVQARDKELYAWLSPRIIETYTEMHRRGKAICVSVYDTVDGRLVGGLYGMMINYCFIGESMFSLVPSGSKIALIGLARWLKELGEYIIDVQIHTSHLESMGAKFMSYPAYLSYLNPDIDFGDMSPFFSIKDVYGFLNSNSQYLRPDKIIENLKSYYKNIDSANIKSANLDLLDIRSCSTILGNGV